MKTGMKTKLLRIVAISFIACNLYMPVTFSNEIAETTEKVSVVEENIVVNSDTKNKDEIKHVANKFGHTMLLVLGASLTIILLLMIYKRITSPKTVTKRQTDIAKDLESPETIEDATRFFIEKF